MLKLFRFVITKVWKYADKAMLAEIICVVSVGILQPLSTLMLQKVIDAISELNIVLGSMWAVLFVFGLVLQGGLISGRSYIIAVINRNVGEGMQQEAGGKFSRIEYWIYEDKHTKDILQQISEKPYQNMVNVYEQLLNIVMVVISFLGYLSVLVQMGYQLSLAFCILSIVNVLLAYRAMNISINLLYDQTADEREMDYLSELLQSKHTLAELRLFHSVNYIINLWKSRANDVLRYRLKMTIKSQLLFVSSGVLSIIWLAALFIMLIIGLGNGRMSLGMFIAFVESGTAMIAISNQVSNYVNQISKNMAMIKVYTEFESLPEKERIINQMLEKQVSCIEFRNVSFKYPTSEKWVLKNVSFSVSPGECVAFVGKNGAGKSTIIKLICGLYKPQMGEVLIDGKSTFDLSDAELKGKLNVIFQNFERFHLTIRQNITLSDQCLPEEDKYIKAALISAECQELSSELDQILGTEEGGRDLSGGQWQKLAIARALYGNGKYILMDEPTAAMDPIAENEMYERFINVFRNKGGIIISHRLASTYAADRIIVLAEGEIVEQGTKNELMAHSGVFAEMWEAQRSWYVGGDVTGEKEM